MDKTLRTCISLIGIATILVCAGFVLSAGADELITMSPPDWAIKFDFVPVQFSSSSPQFMFEIFEPPRLPRVGECLMLIVYDVLWPTTRDPATRSLEVKARLKIVPCPSVP